MTILIQGAMDCELDVFIEHYKPIEVKTIGGYNFYICDCKGNKIVLSKTDMGVINSSISTTVGIREFEPDLVINQGCAGAHVADIKVGDLIIGEKSVYINDFRSEVKKLGEGSDSLTWRPCRTRSYTVASTPKYVQTAERVAFDGRKYVGKLGSGDLFSKEVDRINYLHKLFGELCEDMESVAALRACELFDVDRLALRTISNNEITLEEYDKSVCGTMQRFVIALVDEIIKSE